MRYHGPVLRQQDLRAVGEFPAAHREEDISLFFNSMRDKNEGRGGSQGEFVSIFKE